MDLPPGTPRCKDGRYGDEFHPQTAFEYFEQYKNKRVYPLMNESLALDLPLSGYASTTQRDEQITNVLLGAIDGDDANSSTSVVDLFCHPIADLEVYTAGSDVVSEELLLCPVRRDALFSLNFLIVF
jgi:hypothetical protein